MEQKELELLIEELRILPKENEWVEFKVNNNKPQSIGEYISALSNSACLKNKEHAYLVFGIDDETHNIVGTNFNPDNENVGNQELESWLTTLLNPRIDFNIFRTLINDKKIVLFQIDATSNTPVTFKNESFVRIGSYKKKLKDHPEKERKIWQKVKNVIFEKEIAKKNVSINNVLKLINYPSVFSLLNIPLPINRDTIIEKLKEEKLIIRKHNNFSITNLGAILFANNLNDFDNLDRKSIRVVIYKGKNKLHTIKEQSGMKGYALGFQGLVDYINDQLPVNEEIGKTFRKEVRMYPELAIRELVANAIIHQDFSITGTSSMIEIFENRIEITNPGKPLIDTQRFIDHAPESRNEKVAKFMRRMNFCEERGSGIDKVINQVELYQLPAPDFITGDNFTRIILYAPKSLRQMSKLDKTRACYQHCCIKYISGEYMSNQSLRTRFGIIKKNYPIVSRIIKETIDRGLITEYEDSRMYLPFWAE